MSPIQNYNVNPKLTPPSTQTDYVSRDQLRGADVVLGNTMNLTFAGNNRLQHNTQSLIRSCRETKKVPNDLLCFITTTTPVSKRLDTVKKIAALEISNYNELPSEVKEYFCDYLIHLTETATPAGRFLEPALGNEHIMEPATDKRKIQFVKRFLRIESSKKPKPRVFTQNPTPTVSMQPLHKSMGASSQPYHANWRQTHHQHHLFAYDPPVRYDQRHYACPEHQQNWSSYYGSGYEPMSHYNTNTPYTYAQNYRPYSASANSRPIYSSSYSNGSAPQRTSYDYHASNPSPHSSYPSYPPSYSSSHYQASGSINTYHRGSDEQASQEPSTTQQTENASHPSHSRDASDDSYTPLITDEGIEMTDSQANELLGTLERLE